MTPLRLPPSSGPRPGRPDERERDALVLRLAGEGKTLREIGEALGVTRERARQLLVRLGHTTADFPARAVCSFCGKPLPQGRAATRSGLHLCTAPACVRAYKAARYRARHESQATGETQEAQP